VTPDAFVRARRYLLYTPAKTWAALLMSLLSGVFLVGVISCVGIFVDLLAERGSVQVDAVKLNSYRLWYASNLDEPILHDPPTSDVGLVSLAWRTRDSWCGDVFAGIARNLPWTRANDSLLIGLVVTSGVIVLLWCGTLLLLHVLAAAACTEAVTRLRRAVYHQTYRLGTLTLRALGVSEAIGIFARFLEAMHEGLYAWVTVLFREPARLLTLAAFALLVEIGATGGFPWLTLAFLLFAALAWLVGGRFAAFTRRQERQTALRLADQLVLLQESLQVMRLVKCYMMELFNQTRVERQLARYGRLTRRRHLGRAIFVQAFKLLGFAGLAMLLVVLGWNILAGQLGLGSAAALATAWAAMGFTAWNWLRERRTLKRARKASAVVFAFLDRRGDVGEEAGADFLQPLSKEIEFYHVTLTEPGTGRLLLERVSLSIPAGSRVGIVGQDDLAKHALVYLISRFLDPAHGQVRIDGANLRHVTLQSLRAQVAMVMQHDLVFHDTVAHNIGCGDPAFTLPQIIEAAKVAHCHQFIQQLPEGYETRIGELGHGLDIGQKFRIALARAILRDPSIVIIEETFEHLDDDTKAMIDDTYSRFLPGRTVIFLPHRLSTIRTCDQLCLLKDGRIEAQGTHRELVADNELYRHLEYLEFHELPEHVGS
jgi:ATP-binding cassette, subfamily B, bacterial